MGESSWTLSRTTASEDHVKHEDVEKEVKEREMTRF